MQNIQSNKQKSDIDQYKHSFRIDITNRNGSDVSLDITGDETGDEDQNAFRSEVHYDTEDRYERLQPVISDGHIYTGHIPQVMRDILVEMPPGMTAEDILKMCADVQPTQNESDDEDPEENSDYMEGETQQPHE